MSQPPVPSSTNASGDKRAGYGGARVGKKNVILTRPPNQAWTCRQCSRTSVDIRQVCGNCLSVEPSTGTAESKTDPQQQCFLNLEPPGKSNDPGVRFYRMSNTRRVYRQFVEPLGVDLDKKAKHSANLRPGIEDENGEGIINDPSCSNDLPDDPSDDAHEPLESSVLSEKRDTGTSPTPKTSQQRQSSKKSSQFTHFISLPIGKLPAVRPLAEAFLKKLCDFLEQEHGVDKVSNELTTIKEKGDDKSPVRYPTPEDVTNVDKLHITLLMLSLHTDKEVEFAKTLLHAFAERWTSSLNSELKKKLDADYMEKVGVRVTLGGLRAMPNRGRKAPDSRQCGVIYMELHNTVLLRRLQDLLFNTFEELITDKKEINHSKLLHMTIINKKWTSDPKLRFFDATEVLKCFGNETIGSEQGKQDSTHKLDVWVDRLELNLRACAGGSTDVYQVEDAILL